MGARAAARILSPKKILGRALEAAVDAAALLAADALLQSVSLTRVGLLVAVVVMQLVFAPVGLAISSVVERSIAEREDGQRMLTAWSCLLFPLMFVGLMMIVARAPLAALVTPGFEIDGFWSYAATASLSLVAVLATGGVGFLVAHVRREKRSDVAGGTS